MGVLRSNLPKSTLKSIHNRVPRIGYRLRDLFLTPRLPGAVNGTAAEPGPGTRTVTDTINKMDIGNGRLSLGVTAINGDPGIWYDAITRQAGRFIIFKDIISDFTSSSYFGFDLDTASTPGVNSLRSAGINLRAYDSGGLLNQNVATVNPLYYYSFAVLLRETGAFHFYNESGNGWKLLYISAINNTASVFPTISNINVMSMDEVTIPQKLWLPAPLLSDGFASTNEPDAVDYGSVNDGDYVRVGLGGDARKAFFDGVNSYCDIYSADLNNKFNGQEASIIVRCRIPSAAVWNDGVIRGIVRLYVDANNEIYVFKNNAVNSISAAYRAGGVLSSDTSNILAGSLNEFTVGITCSDTDNQSRVYIEGSEIAGSPSVNAGVWAGNLNVANTVIGAANNTPLNSFSGWLSNALLFYGIVVTPAQMADIHAHLDAGTMTEQWLNDTFGTGTWSWWKMNESFESDGLGHAEGIAGGIGAGGDGLKWEQMIGAFDYDANTLHCSFLDGSRSIAAIDCKSNDVIITGELTRSAGAIGITARYTDTLNYLFVYHSGGNVILTERIAGVQNNLLIVGAVYGAGKEMRLILDGQNARVYYDDVLIGAAVINDNLPVSAKHGVYSGSINNNVDNFTVYARGTNGEYELLESF